MDYSIMIAGMFHSLVAEGLTRAEAIQLVIAFIQKPEDQNYEGKSGT